jgi:hypothetical protein
MYTRIRSQIRSAASSTGKAMKSFCAGICDANESAAAAAASRASCSSRASASRDSLAAFLRAHSASCASPFRRSAFSSAVSRGFDVSRLDGDFRMDAAGDARAGDLDTRDEETWNEGGEVATSPQPIDYQKQQEEQEGKCASLHIIELI